MKKTLLVIVNDALHGSAIRPVRRFRRYRRRRRLRRLLAVDAAVVVRQQVRLRQLRRQDDRPARKNRCLEVWAEFGRGHEPCPHL